MFLLGDIGGTKMRLAVSASATSISNVVIEPTPAEPTAAIDRIIEYGKTRGKLDGACLGITGVLDEEKNQLVFSPHLPAWLNVPLGERLRIGLGLSVMLENDTALVALGEAHFGAGRGSEILAYLTVSTGIGGARIVGGTIDRRHFGFEPGHQILDYRALAVWEDLISGSALVKKFGREPRELTDPAIWQEGALLVAIGLHNVLVHWSPDRVVLGGSMITGTPSISVAAIRDQLAKISRVFSGLPAITAASLGDEGGLYGALAQLSTIRP